MLKLSINARLVNAFINSVVAIKQEAEIIEDTHPKLKAILAEKNSKKKENNSAPVGMLPRLSGFINQDWKYGSIKAVEDEYVLQLKGEFLIDLINCGTKLVIKSLKPTADMFCICEEHLKDIKDLETKWSDKPKSPVVLSDLEGFHNPDSKPVETKLKDGTTIALRSYIVIDKLTGIKHHYNRARVLLVLNTEDLATLLIPKDHSEMIKRSYK